jgi:hypothetical protein
MGRNSAPDGGRSDPAVKRTALDWGALVKTYGDSDISAYKKTEFTRPYGPVDWVALCPSSP